VIAIKAIFVIFDIVTAPDFVGVNAPLICFKSTQALAQTEIPLSGH
jgi:hypothetical protein